MTLVIGKVATDGAILIADRMVSARHHVLGSMQKIVDLPDGSCVGVAGNKWSCEQVINQLSQCPIEEPVTAHVFHVLEDVRKLPHPEYNGASGAIIPSVKAILLSIEDGNPQLHWSRRTKRFQPIDRTYFIGDIDSDSSSQLQGVLDKEQDCLQAIRACWLEIRKLEERNPGGGIGLCGENADFRLARRAQIHLPSQRELGEINRSVEDTISKLGSG